MPMGGMNFSDPLKRGSSPDHSQILSRRRGEKYGCKIKSGSGLGTKLGLIIVYSHSIPKLGNGCGNCAYFRKWGHFRSTFQSVRTVFLHFPSTQTLDRIGRTITGLECSH